MNMTCYSEGLLLKIRYMYFQNNENFLENYYMFLCCFVSGLVDGDILGQSYTYTAGPE